MLGMARAQRWSYLQRPRPWREFHHCFGAGGGAGGAVSSSAGRASMARNRQVPRRSGSAIGVASEVILREIAWRHPQWHQVGSRGILLQRASSAFRTRVKTSVIERRRRTISSSAGHDTCHCTGGEFNKSVVCWLDGLSSRRAI